MATAFYLMASLPLKTWIRLVVWLVIGMIIYFSYGRKHSKVQQARTLASVGSGTGD